MRLIDMQSYPTEKVSVRFGIPINISITITTFLKQWPFLTLFVLLHILLQNYVHSKTLAEKEILSYDDYNNDGLEVVTLACGVVGGDALLSQTPNSVSALISQLTDNPYYYQLIRALEEMLGKVPIIHVDDVCETHIFCMEKPSIHGRFLCSSSYISLAEITEYYQRNYPQYHIKPE